jgi:hypothetical protein
MPDPTFARGSHYATEIAAFADSLPEKTSEVWRFGFFKLL